MIKLTPQEVYDIIREGAADGGWQGFASRVQDAFMIKNQIEQTHSIRETLTAL